MPNAALISLLVAALVVGMRFAFARPRSAKQRIATLIQATSPEEAAASVFQTMKMENSIAQKQNTNWLRHKELQLKQSDTGITLQIYLIILISACFGIFIFVYTIMRSFAIAVPFAFLGMYVPETLVKARIAQNVERFNAQLVKALRRMASVVRSGGTLKEALIDTARARSMSPAIQSQLTKVLADVEYGKSFEDALFALYERTGSKDVMQLAVAVEIQNQQGGDMAKTFDSIGQAITNRNLMQSDVKATLAQNRASSTALSVMPFVMVLLLMFISPGYFSPMLGTVIGRFVFLLCFIWIGLGVIVIRKMSNLKL